MRTLLPPTPSAISEDERQSFVGSVVKPSAHFGNFRFSELDAHEDTTAELEGRADRGARILGAVD